MQLYFNFFKIISVSPGLELVESERFRTPQLVTVGPFYPKETREVKERRGGGEKHDRRERGRSRRRRESSEDNSERERER